MLDRKVLRSFIVPQQDEIKSHHSVTITNKEESDEERESGLNLNSSTGWAKINFDHRKINHHNSSKALN